MTQPGLVVGGRRWVAFARVASLFACGAALVGGCSAADGTVAGAGAGGSSHDGGAGTSGNAGSAGTSGGAGSAGTSGGAGAAGSAGAGSGGNAGSGGSAGSAGSAGTAGGSGDCDPSSPDLMGCPCTGGATRNCYPSSENPATRGVGHCGDGTQACQGTGEIQKFGPCTGASIPVAEVCANGVDDDCNGIQDCGDPSCAADTGCNGACTDGQTRACYDGPPGTVNVGTCKSGTQTCVNSQWSPACVGAVKPIKEVCTDTLDHNCNGRKGCGDLLACLASNYCWGQCTNPTPGCVCPIGTQDNATCPDGTWGTTKSNNFGTGKPPDVECCPCTVDTCGARNCCGDAVCRNSGYCTDLTCNGLPASCNGRVDFDCDFEDYNPSDSSIIPEDCDMPCCKCRPGC